MLKKKISFLTALVMLATLFTGQIPAQAKAGFVESGYTIIDSAYNDGTYVVMAKNLSNLQSTPAKIYTSADGRNWKETLSETSATKWGSPKSKQNLLWWEKQKVFVAAVGQSIYLSSDGASWTQNTELENRYAIVDEKNGKLAVGDAEKGGVKTADSLTESTTTALEKASAVNVMSVADKTESGTGYFVADTWSNHNRITDLTKTVGYHTFPGTPVDSKYLPSMNGWMVLSNSQQLTNITMTEGFKNFDVTVGGNALATGQNLSALGVDDSTVVVGDTTGKIYTMNAPSARITTTQDLTEASPATGTAAIAEEVTDITALGGGEFFVTTATGVYNLKSTDEGYQYTDMLSYKEIGQAKVIGSLPFDGVTLLGGVYSPELNRYVVYGNDSDGKGHIYYSNNGIDWIPTSIGTQTLTWGFDTNAKNLAVWWPEQQKFVISVATARSTQSCWYSSDGISWGFMRKNGFGDEGDIQVMGKYLYASYKGSRKAIRRFTALDGNFENIFYQRTDISPNCTTMAVSDDETPVILVGAGYGQTFINAAVAEGDTTKAKLITPGGAEKASSQMRDVHWNTNIDKFVGVNKINNIVYMIDRDASVTSVTPSADSGILAAIETNGSSYLTGGAAGKLYYSANANISATSSFAETAFEGFKKNTLPVTNIFKGADGKYFATASDGKDNDILIVSADGSEYQKASELVSLASVSAGDTFTVSVKAKNYTSKSESIRLIAAIYDQTGTKLLQVVSGDKTMAQDSESVLSLDVTAAENVTSSSKMKVFIWDSINGMVPVAGEAKSFF